ncbi:GGDEF domain-containing protein [Streptomyces paludis]|uniref:GGDEF domain-containing protein n=1 Tax=Streptomyces paludis TaxID=2282738 RepID=A0A345HSJ2_9ACTN|nr:GGDEF domain-containing protein [Streptomyces paludis]AXG79666.1 GGDEF domain-containing protein [Streptomyces paludis]
MSTVLSALAAAAPLAAGWSFHSLRLRRQVDAARRDPLTGLWTRDAFTERAARTLSRGRRGAVYLIDLDRFKEINDTHGHAAGDAVIRATGHRLTEWADIHAATVARLGGDEFAAVSTVHSSTELVWMLDGLTHSLEEPVRYEGHVLTVGASIGAVTHDPAVDGVDLSALLRLADEEMYRAKRTGTPWQIASDHTSGMGTVNGRRAGRTGTHGATGATS